MSIKPKNKPDFAPAPTGMKPSGFHHIALATRDASATYDFYHNKLGMELVFTEFGKQDDGRPQQKTLFHSLCSAV
jgi:catechol-2,3-dioxygenase